MPDEPKKFVRYRTKDDYALERVLTAWYGREEGRANVMQWMPKAKSFQDLLSPIEKQMEGSRPMDLTLMQSMWSEFVGVKLAKYSRPLAFRDKQLIVEVNRAMFMPELIRMRQSILLKIQETFGDQYCSGFWFAPKGSAPVMADEN